MKLKSLLLGGALTLGLASAALAGGYFTVGATAISYLFATGGETIPLDTNYPQGSAPQSGSMTLNALKAFERAPATLTFGATSTPDYSLSALFIETLTGATTMAAPLNLNTGATFRFKLIQDATGSRIVTWNAAYKWPGGTAPTLTTTAAAVDVISCTYDGTVYLCSSSLNVH